MNRYKFSAIIPLLLALTACGGGGGDAPAVEKPQAVVASNMLFLGNSLTYYPITATYNGDISQWGQGGWGMAASAPDKDFAHIVAKTQALPFVAMNLADNERDPAAPLPAFTVDAGTIVVIQLGDNGLAAKYGEFVQRAHAGRKLVCLSSWGNAQALRERDASMRAQCEAGGGRWVVISDLAVTADNIGPYGHPNDAAMAAIAARINEALK